jgi:predicted acylesterase/phospholipase RssA
MVACKYLVFGGGTLHGCMYLGALIAMFNNNRIGYANWARTLKGVAGTSVGALIAALLTVWDPWTIWEYVKTKGFRKIAESLFDQNIVQVTKGMSINSGRALETLLQKGMHDLTGNPNITFTELYKLTGKTLVVTVTNLDTGFAEYWSAATVPRMEVWRALRASVSLPILFPPFKVSNALYTDGGLACNVPCQLFPAAETLTFFVHAPVTEQTQTPGYLRQLAYYYSDAAQLGQFRAVPAYAVRSVPCKAAPHSASSFALNASNEEIDALVAQGALCWNAVCAKTVCICLCIYFASFLKREATLTVTGGSLGF